jgi:hypothetical protein
MHVGLSLIFQGSATRTDHEVYADELKLARLAEPLGFDSVWTVEHHFTSYTMVPDPLQFLTYMAGCTERVQLGTMVVVLPWHDPVRPPKASRCSTTCREVGSSSASAAGLGRAEFGGFGVSMDESRARFVERVSCSKGSRRAAAARGHLLPAGTAPPAAAPFRRFGTARTRRR